MKSTDYLIPILLGALLFVLSGCLTIKETYTFKKNGSGSMTYALEFDQVDPALGERNQEFLPANWSFDSLAAALQTIPGISRVEVTGGRGDRYLGLGFRFQTVSSLNVALSKILLTDSSEVHPFFSYDGDCWVRNHRSDRMAFSEGFLTRSKDEREVAALLSRLKYEVSMSFKKSVGLVYSGTPVHLTGRKNNEVRMSASLADISASPETLSATILLD